METSKEVICRLAVTVRVALVAALLLSAMPSWAGPLLSISLGPGGKFHTGPKSDPDAVGGNASNLGSMIAGTDVFRLLKGNLWFNSEVSIGGHHTFFAPGQQLLVTGWIDPDHDGGLRDRKDIWGVLIAAKLLNYRLLVRNGETFFVANVLEVINPKLAALLGLHKTTYDATLELQLLQIKSGKQVYDAIEWGVLTTGAVPEPPSIVFLGVPLLWLGTKRWVRRSPLRPFLAMP